jgi:hypothetical protein
MAREVIIRIRDDLDPEALADKTVPFAYNGTNYEIDLNAEHCDEFDYAIERFVRAARIVVPEPAAKRKYKRRVGPDGVSTTALANRSPAFEQRSRIREWAQQTGFHVTNTGVIAKRIIQAYAEIHPDDPIRPDTWCKTANLGGNQKNKKRHNNQVAQSVVAQDGSEQSVLDLLEQSSSPAQQGAATARRNGLESHRFGLSKDLRDKIRLWAIGHKLDQGVKGQLKTTSVEAYFEAHPQEKPTTDEGSR